MFRLVILGFVGIWLWLDGTSVAFAAIKRDLTFDGDVTVTGTGSLGSGSTISVAYKIKYSCKDDGSIVDSPCSTSEARKSFSVQFDYCETSTTTSCTTVLKTITNSTDWSILTFSGETRNFTETLTLPNTVKNGSRFIRVLLDSASNISETNENNNEKTGTFTVGEKPDLSIKTLTVSPTAAKAGDTVTVSYQFCNDGKAASSVDAKFRFYYSTDTTINTSDTYLNKEVSASINAGTCATAASTTVTIPTTATTSPFYIGVIADYDTKEAESNENNNTKYATLSLNAVDLVVKTLTLSTTTVQQGIAFTANYQVCNQGNTDVTSNIKFRFYYSLDATVDTTDTYLNQEISVSLKAGVCHPASGTNSVSLSIPTTAPFGDMYVGLIADYDKKIAESNENNNVSSVKIKFKDRDEDEDGVPADQDCNDKDKTIYPRYNNNPAATEICDGKDNDCNGTIDDIADLGKACTDTTRKGECQAGTWACVNKVKTCKQTTTSSPEVCDGKDNNCDGMIDNGINCSETVSEPAQEPAAEPTQEPVSEPVQPQEVTTQDGGTTDASTPESTTDTNTTTDSDPGDSTTADTSSSDTCDNVTCNAGEFCRAGKCYKSCGCTKCDKGKSCNDGVCVDDSCGGVTCATGKVCEASSGQCINDPCDGVNCNSGDICIEGSCQKDPCANVKCYNNQSCYRGQCYDDGCRPNQPQEPVAEPADETAAETIADTSSEAASEATPEPVSEPTPEPAEEKATEDASTQETSGTTDTPTQETSGAVDTSTGSGNEGTTDTGSTGGCGCQAQQTSWPVALLFLLLFAFVTSVYQRRSSR